MASRVNSASGSTFRFSTRQITTAGLLGALVVVLGLTPLGFVPVPTPAGSATTIHIPVILAGVLEGPVVGGVVGLIFGIFSWMRAGTGGNPIAVAMFSDPLVAVLPRVLIGIVSYYAYAMVKNRKGQLVLSVLSGALVASASWSMWTKAGATLAGGLFAAALGLLVAAGAYVSQSREKPTVGYLTAAAIALVFGIWVFFGVGIKWAIAWRVLAAIAAGVGIGGAFLFAFRGESSVAGFGAVIGTATNTAGVLTLAVVRGYLPAPLAWTVAAVQGLPECFVAAVLVILIERGVRRALRF